MDDLSSGLKAEEVVLKRYHDQLSGHLKDKYGMEAADAFPPWLLLQQFELAMLDLVRFFAGYGYYTMKHPTIIVVCDGSFIFKYTPFFVCMIFRLGIFWQCELRQATSDGVARLLRQWREGQARAGRIQTSNCATVYFLSEAAHRLLSSQVLPVYLSRFQREQLPA